jgi:hypothetical protein
MIPNGQIIAVNFLPGAAGKFIQNCLGLSRHCVLKKLGWLQWQIDCPVSQYSQKLRWALSTVPPADRTHDWLAYELRDDDFFGRIFYETSRGLELPEHLYSIADAGLWCTYSSHSYGGAKLVEEYWPVVRYLELSPAVCSKMAPN